MKLTIKTKLILGFTVVLSMLAASAVLGIKKLSGSNDQLNTVIDSIAAKAQLAAGIKQEFVLIHRAEKNMILLDTAEQMNQQAQQADQFKQALVENMQKLEALADTDDKTKLKDFDTSWQQFNETD